MTEVNPSMRPKVKRDTFFLPDSNGSVYFRNNVGSFSMEGSAIDQWIEKLFPVFNGEHTLSELTEGLPDPYRYRVYEIAEKLYDNGFVRDVSQDRPHQLSEEILQKYGSQIEFLDSFGDSGAFHFQCYRQAQVLAVGSGPLLVSLVAALLESGLPKLHVLITDSVPTDRQRLVDLAAHARKTDHEVTLEEVIPPKKGVSFWCEAIKPFDSIMYVSQEGDIEELRVLHAVCREEKKLLLPAVFVQQAGLAGPLVHPDSEGCWESAWRRVHQIAISKDPELHIISSTAGAMLANVIVFELFKKMTKVTEAELNNKLFLLNLETLEGEWYSFIPHPQVTGYGAPERLHNLELLLEGSTDSKESSGILPYFDQLTSSETGIFHTWEEGDLKQLPLSQCRVQSADPLSEGPAELLPAIVCSGFTHEEARREAGLAGMEAYVSRMADLFMSKVHSDLEAEGIQVNLQDFVGVGAGETIQEGICRGLQACLSDELGRRMTIPNPPVVQVTLNSVEDERCRFYRQALTTIQGAPPSIGLGEELFGLPVVWVGMESQWYVSVGLNVTKALRMALQQALQDVQNQVEGNTKQSLKVSSVLLTEKTPQTLDIPASEEGTQAELQNVLQTLKGNGKRIVIFNLALEPFMYDELAGVFGVLLREEASS